MKHKNMTVGMNICNRWWDISKNDPEIGRLLRMDDNQLRLRDGYDLLDVLDIITMHKMREFVQMGRDDGLNVTLMAFKDGYHLSLMGPYLTYSAPTLAGAVLAAYEAIEKAKVKGEGMSKDDKPMSLLELYNMDHDAVRIMYPAIKRAHRLMGGGLTGKNLEAFFEIEKAMLNVQNLWEDMGIEKLNVSLEDINLGKHKG